MPQAIQDLGGPATIRVPAQGQESSRFDFDFALKYRVNQYFTPFIGYRRETLADIGLKVKEDDPAFQQVQGEIAGLLAQGVASGAITAQEAAVLGESLNIDELLVDLDFDFVVFGASLAYPLPELGLVPYGVGTGFAWTTVSAGGGDTVDQSFPGYSFELGLVYLLGKHFDLPLYVTGSVRYQFLTSDDTFRFVLDLFEGAEDVVPVEEEVLNTNFAIFYRFDL